MAFFNATTSAIVKRRRPAGPLGDLDIYGLNAPGPAAVNSNDYCHVRADIASTLIEQSPFRCSWVSLSIPTPTRATDLSDGLFPYAIRVGRQVRLLRPLL